MPFEDIPLPEVTQGPFEDILLPERPFEDIPLPEVTQDPFEDTLLPAAGMFEWWLLPVVSQCQFKFIPLPIVTCPT